MTIEEAAAFLRTVDDVGVLTHRNPDGDCLGSASALCKVLRALNKRAVMLCSDPVGTNFSRFLAEPNGDFLIKTYVSVDVAAPDLLGSYRPLADEGKIALCIDHHPSNTGYAERTVVEPKAAATAELIFRLTEALSVPINKSIATALYIGIITDTGCFQFSNTTPETHRIAARLMEAGAPAEQLSRVFFGTKTRGRLALEAAALSKLCYFQNGRVAVMTVTEQMRQAAAVSDSELDGLSALPRQIEGVEIGILLREKQGEWRVSVRTNETADASAVCAAFGGGGHIRAAGCTVKGEYESVLKQLSEECEKELSR